MRPEPPGTQNEVSGLADNVVQVGKLVGDVHVHPAPVPLSVDVPNQLPGSVRHFVGRQLELAALNFVLQQRTPLGDLTTPTVILSGSPGVGKTALLTHWARQSLSHFPDGVLYADMQGFASASSPRNPSSVVDGFLRSLKVADVGVPIDLEDKVALYRSMVSNRQMLVFLDNVDSSDRVRPLLAGSDRCLTLIASRSMLSGLVARDGAYRMTLDMLPPQEANELFRAIVGAERVDEEPEAAAEMVRLCAYLPLAIRIAAERVSAQPYARLSDVVGDLSQEAGRLDLMSTEDDEATAVRAVFSWSYRPLDPPVARMFRLLGLCPMVDISTEAAAALAGTGLSQTRQLLFKLTSLHLLTEHQRGRYRLHDLLRVYAYERAQDEEKSDELENAVGRLLDWYLDSAQAANLKVAPGAVAVTPSRNSQVSFESFSDALTWFETERENLRLLIRHAEQLGRYHHAAYLPLEMGSYFNIRKYWTDWLYCNQIGISAARQSKNNIAEAWLLTNRGTALRNLRQWTEAIECHELALRLFDELGNPAGIGFARQNLANAQADEKRFDLAMPNFELALASFGSMPSGPDAHRGEGVTLNSMGVAYNNMAEYDNALTTAERAMVRWTELGSDHGIAFSRYNMGNSYLGMHRYDEALASFEAALRIRRDIQDRHGEARTLLSLGITQNLRGDPSSARTSWEAALEIFTDLSAPEADDVTDLLAGLAIPEGQ